MLCYLNSNEIAHDVVTTCPVRIGIKKRARCCDYWDLVYTRKKVAVYDIEAVNQQEAEKQAVEQYKKDKDARLNPRLAEAVDKVEAEDTQYP